MVNRNSQELSAESITEFIAELEHVSERLASEKKIRTFQFRFTLGLVILGVLLTIGLVFSVAEAQRAREQATEEAIENNQKLCLAANRSRAAVTLGFRTFTDALIAAASSDNTEEENQELEGQVEVFNERLKPLYEGLAPLDCDAEG